jgi:hypothetical protein
VNFYDHISVDFSKVEKLSKLPVVYVLSTHDFSYIKIGTTTSMKQRQSNIQSGCPFELFFWLGIKTPIASEVEKHLLNKYKEFNLRGEWFSFGKNQLDEILEYFHKTNQSIKKAHADRLAK